MAKRPRAVSADGLDRDAQRLLDPRGFVGRLGDGLQQHRPLLLVVQVAGGAFRDRLSGFTRAALALQPPLERRDPGLGSLGFRLVYALNAITSRHRSSPRCMHCDCEISTDCS